MNTLFRIHFWRRWVLFTIDISIAGNPEKSIRFQIKSPDIARKKLSNFVALD